MKNENYINIQGFMINELGLQGNELILYAIIYGFTQDGVQKYRGSLSYIQNALKIGKNTAIRNLKKLEEKGLIQKEERTTGNLYFISSAKMGIPKMGTECTQNGYRSVPKVGTESVPIVEHNNNNNNNNNNNIIIKKNTKKSYGEFKNVKLSDEEFEKLENKFSDVQEKIEKLSAYISSTGKRYKNHYATILNWSRSEKTNAKSNGSEQNTKFYY